MCERWRSSFAHFMADMGPKPSPELTLERINNDGNYEPGNCKWATTAEQQANKQQRSARRYSAGDESLSLEQFGARLGVGPSTLRSLVKHGFPLEYLVNCGIPRRFSAKLKSIWPYPDRAERHRLIMMWRKMDVPLRVCGELLGLTRERVRQIEANFHEEVPSYANGLRKTYEYRPDTIRRGRPPKGKPYRGLDDESLLSLGMS